MIVSNDYLNTNILWYSTNKWQNSIVSFAEIHVYIYYILESNLSSDQQWPEAVLIVLKFYFSAKNYGGCQKEMLEIHNVFLL